MPKRQKERRQSTVEQTTESYATLTEYAARRRVNKRTVGKWIALGLPSVKQPGGRRIVVARADSYIDDGYLAQALAASKEVGA